MADSKYGRIFTEADVKNILAAGIRAGIEFENNEPTVDGHHDFDVDAVYEGIGMPTKFPEDEPVFVLRGQDPVAVETIRDYAARTNAVGSPAEHVAAVVNALAVFNEFKINNPDRIKDHAD